MPKRSDMRISLRRIGGVGEGVKGWIAENLERRYGATCWPQAASRPQAETAVAETGGRRSAQGRACSSWAARRKRVASSPKGATK